MQISKTEDIAIVVFIGTGAFALVIIALFLFIRLYQSRMRDKENQLLQLESDSRLKLLKSVMEAEEKQKESISKNLHDEIGTALTVLKMNINNLSDELNHSSSPEINSINQSIDNIITDIRSVCRDLMPITLHLIGLNKSIQDFCNTSTEYTKIKIQLESNYSGFLSNQTSELIYFRLFKEVVNNLIKHSKATYIICKIEQNNDTLTTLFQYNGKGTSNSEINTIKKTNTGIGLNSIDSRLMVLNGSINYSTEPECNFIKIIMNKNGI